MSAIGDSLGIMDLFYFEQFDYCEYFDLVVSLKGVQHNL